MKKHIGKLLILNVILNIIFGISYMIRNGELARSQDKVEACKLSAVKFDDLIARLQKDHMDLSALTVKGLNGDKIVTEDIAMYQYIKDHNDEMAVEYFGIVNEYVNKCR